MLLLLTLGMMMKHGLGMYTNGRCDEQATGHQLTADCLKVL